jgi:decaprenylphospho-beta-D-ribofuranose 2-oxidase
MSSKFDPAMQRSLFGQVGRPVRNRAQHPESISHKSSLTPVSQDPFRVERGSGRNQNNPELNSGSDPILGKQLDRILNFNERTGLLTCGAGVTLEKIVQVFGPQGWFPIVTPETKFVTVGDAVAFDVHGHNHHRDGSFCHYVRRLTLVLAGGETLSCSREKHSDLFWATIGGMGLTGTIVNVEFFLRPMETEYCKTLTLKTRDLLDTLALFEKHAPHYQYATAWIDCLASADFLGRSLLTLGNDATLDDLNGSQRLRPLEISPRRRLRVPSGIRNRYTAGLWNELYYHHQPSPQVETIVDYDSFFHPLDSTGNDGKRRVLGYQFVLPTPVSRQGLTCILKFFSSKGIGPFSAVLKRLGEGEGWLSLAVPGYSLAMDIPMQPGIGEFLSHLDRIILAYGGRVHLAENVRLRPEVVRKMYPNYDRWLTVKSQVDPKNCFDSALSECSQLESRWESWAA